MITEMSEQIKEPSNAEQLSEEVENKDDIKNAVNSVLKGNVNIENLKI